MNVTTLNLNGIRSAVRKDWLQAFEAWNPDICLLQEVRAEPAPQLFEGYHSYWHPAEKAGYSGVAIVSKQAAQEVRYGMGIAEFDVEGRVLYADYGPYGVLSVYVPSGSSSDSRLDYKMAFHEALSDYTRSLLHKPLLVGGDFNVAHRAIDLKNWRGNLKNSGFLPQERAWLDAYLALGLRDSHRSLLGDAAEYTWWSNRGQAYTNNVGWRIDYLLATAHFVPKQHQVLRTPRFSDHAPLTVWYDMVY